jgi:thymidylate kinase/aminoglycoside phosphotransferase (APT) family kinase protein
VLLLRGDPADPASDLDLLADDPGLACTRAAWSSAGLGELTHDAHALSFLGYDRDADRWWSVDVADGVMVGPRRVSAAALVERASRSGPLRRPDPDDAWWLALLHEVGERHRPRAERLDRLAEQALALPWALSAGAPDRVDPATPENPAIRAALESTRGLAAAAAEAAAALATHGSAAPQTQRALADLRSAIRGGVPEPIARGRRALVRAASRRRGGITVALLGPDGVGKTTLAASLRGPRDRSPATVYLGLYARAPGTTEAGGLPGIGLARRLVRLVVARVRVARLRAAGRWVVLDRHPLDGVVAAPGGARAARIRRRLLAAVAPAPDLIVVLDAPVDVLLERKQEHGRDRLAAMLEGYRRLARTDPRACRVDATGSADEVRRSVQAVIADRLAGQHPHPVVSRAPAARRTSWVGARARRLVARLDARLELRRATRVAAAILREPSFGAGLGAAAGLARGRGRGALSGTCVFAVVPARDAGRGAAMPAAYLRLARRPAAAGSIRRSARVLRALGTMSGSAELLTPVPDLIATGRHDGWTFLIERACPGAPAVRRAPADDTWLAMAADAVGSLHAATARVLPADGHLLARLVDRPTHRVATRLPPEPALRDALADLGRRTRATLAGGELRVGWVHGDCWAGNILLGPGGSVSGLIDWDSAGCPAPAAVDLVHLLAHARRRRTGATYGQAFLGLLEGVAITDVERRVLASAGLGDGASRPAIRRAMFAITWLYLVDGALRRYPRIAGSGAWVDDVVLRLVPCL